MDLNEALVWLKSAQATADQATCSRLHVGAVLVRAGRIVSTGRNGAPIREAHCRCSPDRQCEVSIHAESNCVAFAARIGMSTVGCTMVITHAPCFPCAGFLINAGIVQVIYGVEYRSVAGVQRLREASIPVESIASLTSVSCAA